VLISNWRTGRIRLPQILMISVGANHDGSIVLAGDLRDSIGLGEAITLDISPDNERIGIGSGADVDHYGYVNYSKVTTERVKIYAQNTI